MRRWELPLIALGVVLGAAAAVMTCAPVYLPPVNSPSDDPSALPPVRIETVNPYAQRADGGP